MTDLTLRRVIDAPVQRVYAAWTDPELLRQWLAPGKGARGPILTSSAFP